MRATEIQARRRRARCCCSPGWRGVSEVRVRKRISAREFSGPSPKATTVAGSECLNTS
ncbi:hypothetical protein M3J09_005052 [Ascochyta lentis]